MLACGNCGRRYSRTKAAEVCNATLDPLRDHLWPSRRRGSRNDDNARLRGAAHTLRQRSIDWAHDIQEFTGTDERKGACHTMPSFRSCEPIRDKRLETRDRRYERINA